MSIKRMDIKEFSAKGYLHEVNRKLLHPLGLALEVQVDEFGNEKLGGIWDYRDDPKGIIFDESVLSSEKAASIEAVADARREARVDALGYWVQPVVTVHEPSE